MPGWIGGKGGYKLFLTTPTHVVDSAGTSGSGHVKPNGEVESFHNLAEFERSESITVRVGDLTLDSDIAPLVPGL